MQVSAAPEIGGSPSGSKAFGSAPRSTSSRAVSRSGAASAPDLDTARLLVERGADPKALDPEGLPPISGAADTCIHTLPAGGSNAQLEAELAMVEYLAPMSDKR